MYLIELDVTKPLVASLWNGRRVETGLKYKSVLHSEDSHCISLSLYPWSNGTFGLLYHRKMCHYHWTWSCSVFFSVLAIKAAYPCRCRLSDKVNAPMIEYEVFSAMEKANYTLVGKSGYWSSLTVKRLLGTSGRNFLGSPSSSRRFGSFRFCSLPQAGIIPIPDSRRIRPSRTLTPSWNTKSKWRAVLTRHTSLVLASSQVSSMLVIRAQWYVVWIVWYHHIRYHVH